MIIFTIITAIVSHYFKGDVAMWSAIAVCTYYPITFCAYMAITPRGYSDGFADLEENAIKEKMEINTFLVILAAIYLIGLWW